MKRISLLILSLLFAIFGICFPRVSFSNVYADTTSITFRGWGDSIAAGYSLEDYDNYDIGVNYTQGCFSDVFSKPYITQYTGSLVCYAESGDQSGNMVAKMSAYTNGTAVDQDDFYNTDIMTVCIGANNVLGPVLRKLQKYILQFGAEEQAALETALAQGVANFENDYLNKILPTFRAKTKAGTNVYVMTIYNPYKYFTLNDVRISPSVDSSTAIGMRYFL